MKVDGRQIATSIYEDLQKKVGELQKKGITPHLTVLLIGDDQASRAYVAQKQKWGEFIKAKVTVLRYQTSVTTDEIVKKVKELNEDRSVHAILIQRPLPVHMDVKTIEMCVNPQKDIDGFHKDSPYTLPLPLSVVKSLKEIYKNIKNTEENFLPWLKSQNIVVLGKGPTGGGPIVKYLIKLGVQPIQIDSKTQNPQEILQKADIIISAVGKPNVISEDKMRKGAILIGVGIFRGEDGKLHGDYDEVAIEKKSSYFTPTPGGVGPINVAMLMRNLIDTTEKQAEQNMS